MRHLLSIADLDRDDVERLLETAEVLHGVDEKLPTLQGKLVLSLFFESSTRTSSSFELAAKRLSADVMSVKSSGSSVDKGESLKDTALTLNAYDPDVIVIRHPHIGAPNVVARVTGAHVVNAGDGKHQHPTQALLDLHTIEQRLSRVLVLAVAGVDDGGVGVAGDELRRPDLRMADDDRVRVVLRQRQHRVLERLTLVDR